MSDRIFYVAAQAQGKDSTEITGYVPAKFLMLNGKPVVDPTRGGSQKAYIFADGSDKHKARGEIANPNNYLIVPANYTEQHARAYAARIADIIGQAYPGAETSAAGLNLALGRMTGGPMAHKTCSDTRSGESQEIHLFLRLSAVLPTILAR